MKLQLNDKRLKIFHIILGMSWLFMQLYFIAGRGIETGFEAAKYIDEADYFLQNGYFHAPSMLFYAVIIFLIAVCIKLNIGFWAIILLQIVLNAISVVCFYKITDRLTKKKWLAIIATFYFLLLFDYHRFNTFLFTESLFFNLSVIYTYALFSLPYQYKWKNILLPLFLLLTICFTRPVGIFFIPATILFLLIRHYNPDRKKKTYLAGGIAFLVFMILIDFSMRSGGRLDFLLPYTKEMVLCEVPGNSETIISVPRGGGSIMDLIYVMIHYPGIFFRLVWLRLISFFGVVRPFYSLIHNAFLAAYFYILYLIIIVFSKSLFQKLKAQVWFLFVPVSLMTTTVMLSCDEWGNRFLLSVAPFILLLAVLAVSGRVDFWQKEKP